MRRRLNSDTFEALMGADLQSKSSIFAGIYSPTKVKSVHPILHEDLGKLALSLDRPLDKMQSKIS